jgi:hypothetical protein
MGILPTRNLTGGYAPTLAEQLRQSLAGMAHFAGSGPAGTVCGGCVFLADLSVGRPGRVRRRRHPGCRKFFQMTGKHGDALPPHTPSCRYYEPVK